MDTGEDPRLLPRLRDIQKFYEEYNCITHEVLGAASRQESESLMEWVRSATATRESIADLEQHKSSYQQMLRSAEQLQRDFLRQLDHACNRPIPLLSRQSYDEWIGRFRAALYKEKEDFVQRRLPEFIGNWETLIAKRGELLKNPRIKELSSEDVQDLAEFLEDAKFGNLSNKKRIGLVASVHAALLAKEKNMPQLFAQAKGMLEAAAQAKALSWSKVGVWLERIFKSGAESGLIAEFINGSGARIAGKKMTLTRLIANWSEASTHFRVIENKRGEFGTPRGFHFVSMEIFLNWGYEQRKAYLAEAEHRFTDIRDEPYVFLRIRHALDCKDWEEADMLIAEVKGQIADGSLLMSDGNAAKLQSMENYRRTHAPLSPQEAMPEEDPEAVVLRMRSALAEIPYPWIQDRFERAIALGRDTLQAYCSLNYNWDWCRRHGYSSDALDAELRERAKEETFDHLKHGQPKGHVNNDMTGNTSVTPAPRWDNDTNSAQAIHVDHTTSNTVLIDNFVHQNRHNRAVWYWTRLMEKDIPFAEVKYIIENIQPVLKRGMRRLERMGVRFTPSGPVAYRDARALAYANGMRPKMN